MQFSSMIQAFSSTRHIRTNSETSKEMRLLRKSQVSRVQVMPTSTIPPPGWMTNDTVICRPRGNHTDSQSAALPRKCPICFETYRPDSITPSADEGSFNDAQELDLAYVENQQAIRIHRRHSATFTPVCLPDCSDASPQTNESRRGSRFMEHLTIPGQDTTNDFGMEGPPDGPLLQVSGDIVQKRRRRSALSCGSDTDAISMGIARPTLKKRVDETMGSVGVWHLNGVPMNFD